MKVKKYKEKENNEKEIRRKKRRKCSVIAKNIMGDTCRERKKLREMKIKVAS